MGVEHQLMVLSQVINQLFILVFSGIKWVLNALKRLLHWSVQKPVQTTLPLLLMFGFIILLIVELTQVKMIIKPFDVYPELEKQGYSGKLFARHYRDQIVQLQSEKREKEISSGVHINLDSDGQYLDSMKSEFSGDKEDFEIPVVGISIKAFARYLKGLAGKESPTITGEVSKINGEQLVITVRYDNKYAYKQITTKNELDAALRKVAEQQFKHIYPFEYIRWTCWQQPDNCEKIIIEMSRTKGLSKSSLASAYVTLGNIASNVEGDANKSLGWYRKSVQLSDSSAPALHNIGVYYYQKKDYPRAIQNFRAAIEADDRYWDAYLGISGTERERGNLEDSIQWLEKIEPDERWSSVYRHWGLTLRAMERHKKAIEKFDEGIMCFPHDKEIRGAKGNSLRLQGQFEEAIKVFENAERLDLVDEKQYASGAMSLTYLGKKQEAIK